MTIEEHLTRSIAVIPVPARLLHFPLGYKLPHWLNKTKWLIF